MKRKWIAIIAILTLIAVFAAACSGTSTTTDTSTSVDGGAGATTVSESEKAEAAAEVQETLSDTSATEYISETVTVSEAQQVTATDEEGAVNIDLSALTADNAPTGTEYKKNVLSIKAAGTYVLTGTLNGAVEVAKNVAGTVRIVLAGATITTLDSQDCAAIVFKESSELRILTIADGSVNYVSDSVGDTGEDPDDAAIAAKKSSLTINGSGTLNVTAVGEDAGGIKVKKELTILSATINVTAVKNGIKADNLILIKDATLSVTAGNDGIKTDIEPETDEEALAYAADPTAGYIYIENSTITVTASDDGIAANSCLYIANGDDDTITVTTNGGAPTTVTERSSDEADGKALKVGGIVLEDKEGNETDYPATHEKNYALVITGGKFDLNSNDDAIHSKGNVLITGGTFTITTGDDGVHAEYLTKIAGGNITVSKCYEGVEGAAVEITGGTVNVTAVDDGVNAANADLKNYTYYIVITGGDVTINCSGDGIDSNGKLLISGGTVTVFGPENGGNSALDSESGTTISGGTVIATCREAMDPIGATQYMVVANVSVPAGTTVTLKNASGETVATFVAPKSCANITISTPQITSGTYTLTYGNNSVSLTATTGTSGGMGGGPGGMGGQPGGMGGRGGNRGIAPSGPDGEMPENGNAPAFPSGEMPEGSTPPELPSGEAPTGGNPPMGPFGFGGEMGEPPQGGMTPPTESGTQN